MKTIKVRCSYCGNTQRSIVPKEALGEADRLIGLAGEPPEIECPQCGCPAMELVDG